MTVVLGIGTVKGGWTASSDDRRNWTVAGPFMKGWEVTAFGRSHTGDALLSAVSAWYGAAIHRSPDLDSWTQIVDGPAYEDGQDRALSRIWALESAHGRTYAGVAEAGLFASDDVESWSPVTGLNEHETRSAWGPGAGGLMTHRILFDSEQPDRMWCGISAVGVFRTDDGGETWQAKNEGIAGTDPDAEFPGIGFCVHGLTADPDNPDRIWRQDHAGVYRSADGGDNWERIQDGLPNESGFGFPVVRHHASGALFIAPLESDEYRLPVGGAFGIYRSTDDGDSWHRSGDGWSDTPAYHGVLRGAMDCDQLDAPGIYYGTTGGTVGFSSDGGDSWDTLSVRFPRISSVRVLAT